MTAKELRDLQNRILFDAPSMAACLEIPYHTYRNYLYGENAVPAEVEQKARALEEQIKAFDAGAAARIDERISKEFPNGIMSEVEAWRN